MAGYSDTRQLIIDTLMGRPAGTEIQPEDHQAFALALNDYIRSVELSSGSTLTGIAESNTVPIEPNDAKVAYIASVPQNTVRTFIYFEKEDNEPITITTTDSSVFVILLWNTQYWEYQSLPVTVLENNSFVGYFECTSLSTDANKTISSEINQLTTNLRILVKMNNVNTQDNATFQIGLTNSKPLYYNGLRVSSTNSWAQNEILDIFYNGVNYVATTYDGTQFSTGERVSNIGIDNVPTAGSENLVKSGGVEEVTRDTVKFTSYNLYDKNKIGVADKYIDHTGTLKDLPDAEVSYLIPIKPNTIYAWEKIGGNGNNCYFRFVKQDGITPLKPLNPSTGEEIGYSTTYGSARLFKSPFEAAFAQFTVVFNNENIKDVVQLIEKDTLQTSTYYPYKKEIPYSNLPDSLLKEVSDIKSELNNKPDDSDLEVINNNIESLKDSKVDKYSINLFDKTNTLNADGYWGGAMLVDGYHHTHPIRVKANTRYKINSRLTFGNSNYAAYVTKTGEFIAILPYVEGYDSYTIFDPPHDGYLSFNYDNADTFMACEESKYPSSYKPYNVQIEENVDLSDFQYSKIESKIEASLIPINESLNSKADTVLEIGKNLFDKSQIIYGYYIYSTTGVNTSNSKSAISPKIEITPGSIYHISRPNISSTGAVVFIDENGNRLKPLRVDGTEWSSYEPSREDTGNSHQECKCKAPVTAKYIQFTVIFNETGNINNTQIELGPDFTGYEEYISKKVLPYVELPKELLKQLDDTEEVINISNSDKIGVFSTSFMNGYAMRNHHHLNHLSMFLDYIIYNYGHSGDDELENLDKLNKDSVWLGVIPPSQWNIKYGVVMHEENSGALKAVSSDTVYQNSKKLANAIKSLGGIPIFSTEHDQDYNYYQGTLRLCEEEGYMFMNWGRGAYLNVVKPGIFTPMWFSGHPATRTGWITTLGMLPYLQSLPRPTQCIKLFRVREGIDTSDLNNLVYDDYYSRAKRFVELTCGVSALSTETEKCFDRLDAGGSYVNINDEYQNIQAKNSVSFGDYALIHIVTPYDRVNLKKAILHYVGTGVTNVYIKKNLKISNGLSSKRYYSFGIIEGENLLSPNDTFTISGITRADGVDLNRTWVVQGIVNGLLVTTTTSSPSQGWTNGKTSGTDNPTCSVEGVVLHGSYDCPSVEYMERFREPLGQFIEVSSVNNIVDLSDYIPQCMDFDSMGILLKGSSISLSDVYVEVLGYNKKNTVSIPMVTYKDGTSIITDNLFDNSTSWENISSLTTFDNTAIRSTVDDTKYEKLPTGITTVKEILAGQSTKQSIIQSTVAQTDNDPRPIKIQFRVIARYFPKYINSDLEWETSEITEQSFDVARLAISIGRTNADSNPMKVAELNVGAYWYQYVFETYGTQDQLKYIKVECTDKKVQIAKLEAVRL